MAIVIKNIDTGATQTTNGTVMDDQNNAIALNENTREFDGPSNYTVAVAGDSNSQILTFKVPAEIDGVDLGGTIAYLEYYTDWTDSSGEHSYGMIDLSDTLQEVVENGITTYYLFNWLLDLRQTAYPGSVKFDLKFSLSLEDGSSYYIPSSIIINNITYSIYLDESGKACYYIPVAGTGLTEEYYYTTAGATKNLIAHPLTKTGESYYYNGTLYTGEVLSGSKVFYCGTYIFQSKQGIFYVDNNLGIDGYSDPIKEGDFELLLGLISTAKIDLTNYTNSSISNHNTSLTAHEAEFALKADKVDTSLLATNLVIGGDFSDGTTGWILNGATYNDGKLVYTSQGSYTNVAQQSISVVESCKYYCAASITNGRILVYTSQNGSNEITATQLTQLVKSTVFTLSSAYNRMTIIANSYGYTGQETFDNIILINLTSTFGAGKEPTAAQMDSMLSYFENSWFNGTANLFNATQILKKQAEMDVNIAEMAVNIVRDGEVISDTTYSTTPIGGASATWSVDINTNFITCSVAHGLVVGDSIIFNSGTGIIPGGLAVEPEFYYVTAVSGNQIQVSLITGGTVVDITSVGTSGWTVKKARMPAAGPGISFTNHKDIDMYTITSIVPTTSPGNSYLLVYASVAGTIFLNHTNGNNVNNYVALTNYIMNKKHSKLVIKTSLHQIDTNLYHISISASGLFSDNANLSTPITYSNILSGLITGASLNNVWYQEGYSQTIKTGTRIIVVGR